MINLDRKKVIIMLRKTYIYAASFILSVGLLTVMFYRSGIYPLGDRSILISDLSNQYIDFLQFWRRALLGGEDLIFSFKLGIGNAVLPIVAYFVASPINWILIFFSENSLPMGVLFITYLKIGLMAVSCTCMLKNIHRPDSTNERILVVAYSIMYALMNYTLFYKQHLMFLDAVIALPLIVSELYRFFADEKGACLLNLRLTALLCLTIISGFYTGYMVCLASPIFILYFLFCSTSSVFFERKIKCLEFLVINGLIAAALSAFILVPTVYNAIESVGIAKGYTGTTVYGFPEIINSLFIGSFKSWKPSGTLPLYCGILAVIPVFLLFFTKEVPRKEKICVGITLLFFYLSLHLRALYLLWHGMDYPSWFEGRFGFVICLYLILVAYRFICCYEIKLGPVVASMAVMGAIIGYMQLSGNLDCTEESLYISATFLLYYFICVYVIKKIKHIAVGGILLCLVCLELVLNGNTVYSALEESYNSYSEYADIKAPLDAIVETLDLRSYDRMEKDYYRRENDAASVGYNGISFFSNVRTGNAYDAMKKLGIKSYNSLSRYVGSTLFTDALLGIRYVVSHEEEKPGYIHWGEMKGGLNAFQNPISAGMFLRVQDAEIGTDFSNPFEYLNHVAKVMFEASDDVYKVDDLAIFMPCDLVGASDGHTYYPDGSAPRLEYVLPKVDGSLRYMYISLNSGDVDIRVNDELIYNFKGYTDRIIDLDDYANGQYPAQITVNVKGGKIDIRELVVAQCSTERLIKEIGGHIQDNPVNVVDMEDHRIVIDIDSEGGQLLYASIPYSTGWKAYLNGRKVEPRKILDGFIAVPLLDGMNRIELKYDLPGFREGALVTFITALGLICYVTMLRFRRKGRVN